MFLKELQHCHAVWNGGSMEEGQYWDLFVKSEGHIGFAEEAESEVDDLHSALTGLGTAAHTHGFMLVN